MSGYNNVEENNITASNSSSTSLSDSFSDLPDSANIESVTSSPLVVRPPLKFINLSELLNSDANLISEQSRNQLCAFFANRLNLRHQKLDRTQLITLQHEIEQLIYPAITDILNIDCTITCRSSKHDKNKSVYNVLKMMESGKNGVISFPIAQFKQRDSGEWYYKTYTDETRKKVAKEITCPKDAVLNVDPAIYFQQIREKLDQLQKNVPAVSQADAVKISVTLNRLLENLNRYIRHVKFLQLVKQEIKFTKRLFAEETENYSKMPEKFYSLLSANMFFMPLLQGDNLDKIIRRGHLLNNDKLCFDIFSAIHQQLMKLHNKGFVHRDLRPSNIMVDKKNKVSIVDMGIAGKINKPAPFWTNYVCLAPELYDAVGDAKIKKAVNLPEQDIFALGLLFSALYGAEERRWILQESDERVAINKENDNYLVGLDKKTVVEIETLRKEIERLRKENFNYKVGTENISTTKNNELPASIDLSSVMPEYDISNTPKIKDKCLSVSSDTESEYHSSLKINNLDDSSVTSPLASSCELSALTPQRDSPNEMGDLDDKSLKQFNSSGEQLNLSLFHSCSVTSTSMANHAIAELLTPKQGKPSTKKLFINTSRMNAPLKIVGLETPGFLEKSKLPANIQTMLRELRNGLVDINPETRLKHTEIIAKITQINAAFIAYEATADGKSRIGMHRQSLL